jgi:hypothetical protein
MFQTVHVCFTAMFIVALCLGFIFLLMCNELCTSKADDIGSGCMNEEQKNYVGGLISYFTVLFQVLHSSLAYSETWNL